ncbi:DUF2188 domain-containing protein [Nocardioides sp. SYSU D00065]|uniref:DUF2188 domain-containing protein n=1 Tax=Nocardioides sp. SYSU D00065 TaxID=2817378 RepID=UPI001B32541F|nr:DUF2188 domain-containing protein [Nocardioides sp. SYSU D00065]
MPEGDIETYHLSETGKWRNRVEGLQELDGEYDTRAEAIEAGRDEARDRSVEHIIRRQDGTIGERNTYGHDPRNVHG